MSGSHEHPPEGLWPPHKSHICGPNASPCTVQQCKAMGPCFLAFHAPALLQVHMNSTQPSSLEVLAEVYRAGRQLFPAGSAPPDHCVRLHVEALKDADSSSLLGLANQGAVWALVRRSDSEAFVEQRSITGLLKLDDDEERHNIVVLEFWLSGEGLNTFDFFLSHKQSNSQDAVMSLRHQLSAKLPAASFWLDLEQNPTEQGMEEVVKHSRNFLLYCTQGVMASKWCLKELQWAMEYRKNIILVRETDDRHGKVEISDLVGEAPPDYELMVKDAFQDNVVIPYYREPDFQAVSLNKILEASIIVRGGI